MRPFQDIFWRESGGPQQVLGQPLPRARIGSGEGGFPGVEVEAAVAPGKALADLGGGNPALGAEGLEDAEAFGVALRIVTEEVWQSGLAALPEGRGAGLAGAVTDIHAGK